MKLYAVKQVNRGLIKGPGHSPFSSHSSAFMSKTAWTPPRVPLSRSPNSNGWVPHKGGHSWSGHCRTGPNISCQHAKISRRNQSKQVPWSQPRAHLPWDPLSSLYQWSSEIYPYTYIYIYIDIYIYIYIYEAPRSSRSGPALARRRSRTGCGSLMMNTYIYIYMNMYMCLHTQSITIYIYIYIYIISRLTSLFQFRLTFYHTSV